MEESETLIPTAEALKIVIAARIVPISLPTIINWIKEYRIGRKVGGRWWVDKRKLIQMLEKGNPNGKTT